jgi:hypothetical protein
MAIIRPNSFIESISGSTCRHDSNYYATNRQTGKTYGIKRCYPSTAPPTEAQTAQRTAFASKSRLAAQWWANNKPSTAHPQGTDDYLAVKAAYKSQHKIGNIFTFVASKMDSEGNLTISVTPINNGNPSGGGNYGGGGNEGL